MGKMTASQAKNDLPHVDPKTGRTFATFARKAGWDPSELLKTLMQKTVDQEVVGVVDHSSSASS